MAGGRHTEINARHFSQFKFFRIFMKKPLGFHTKNNLKLCLMLWRRQKIDCRVNHHANFELKWIFKIKFLAAIFFFQNAWFLGLFYQHFWVLIFLRMISLLLNLFKQGN